MSRLHWPLHPLPFKEEALLSWLSRIAKCYGFTVDELLKHDLGFYGNIEDLDICTPPWLLTLLSNRTGIDEQTIYAMTLSAWTPLLLDDLSEKDSAFEAYVQSYSLLLPLDKRKKYKPKEPWKPWFQNPPIVKRACPICIGDQQKRAIILAWYLPLLLSCPIHQCQLLPCYVYQGHHLVWANENDLEISISKAIIKMDQRTWSALTTGKVALPRRVIHGGIWLRLLRTLLDELHIPVAPINSLHSKNIINLWKSLNLVPRGGQTRWRPYEILPLKIQQQTLMVAALAMDEIEKGIMTISGQQGFLFLLDLISDNDLSSHPGKRKEIIKKSESVWQKTMDSLNELIEIAKKDPSEARNFRNLLLWNKTDFDSIQKANNALIEVGIPVEFLVI